MLEQLRCFWTWPFGHVWTKRWAGETLVRDRCFICGKDA